MSVNMDKEIYEGWTVGHFVQHFIDVGLDNMVIGTSHWVRAGCPMFHPNKPLFPIRDEQELRNFIRDNQPYYKNRIPEVEAFFTERYSEIFDMNRENSNKEW